MQIIFRWDFMIGYKMKEVPEHLKVDIKSISEERANMVSHGVGFLFFIIAVPFLMVHSYHSGVSVYFLGSIFFSVSLLMVYTSSTLYHSSYNAGVRRRLRIFDHISIYFLIAGTYSPFLLTHIQTTLGRVIFIILWSMTVVGSIVKLKFVHRFKIISTLAYLVMGWMALIIIKPLYLELPAISFYWILIGGLMYTLGAFFYLKPQIKYNHLIWHLFVFGGSISHFVAVYYCV